MSKYANPAHALGGQTENLIMSTLWPALIAFLGVLVANFLGEDYKRWREAQALAGAIAGEIDAFGRTLADAVAWNRTADEFYGTYPNLMDFAASRENKWQIDWEKVPKEMRAPVFRELGIYEANLEKIGLL